MNAFQALRRLQAWQEGKPLPRGETLHFPIPPDDGILVIAFVRMGGESAPWGIAWGEPGTEPEVRSVPEPRNRTQVAEMAAAFAPALLGHLFQPEHSGIQISSGKDDRPLRQVWLPNASHAEMLHHLAYAYTFARKGDPARIHALNALGRAAGWLFREFSRPGQIAVMAASEALKESFTFPCEDVRQGHLGYLLAWLETRGNRDARLRNAAAAERRPVSTSLDPALERDELAERVERYGEAEREGRKTDERKVAKEIAAIISLELRHRFDLTVTAIRRLRADKRRRNAGVEKLIEAGWEQHWREYLRTEKALIDSPDGRVFVPSPETDSSPIAAAGRYFAQQGDEDRRLVLLLDDDREMQAEALASGEAIHGTIRSVRDDGVGRTTTPVWEVEADGEAPTKLRAGQTVFLAHLRGRKGLIRSITARKGKTRFTIEITSLKTLPRARGAGVVAATHSSLVGNTVLLLPAPAEGINALKRRKLWDQGAPGSWLTDSRPPGRHSRLPAAVAGPFDASDDAQGGTP